MDAPQDRRLLGIRQQPAVGLLMAVAIGTCLDRYGLGSLRLYGTTVLATGLLWWWLTVRAWDPLFRTLALLWFVAMSGAAWHHWHWHYFPADEISRFAPTSARDWLPARIRGMVVSGVRRRPNPFPASQRQAQDVQCSFELSVEQLFDAGRWRDVSGTLRVLVSGDVQGLSAGDEVALDGRLQKIAGPLNPAELDRRDWSRSQRVLAELELPNSDCLRTTRRCSPWLSRWCLSHWSDHADEVLKQRLGADVHPIASALLLGRREHLSREQRESYLQSGTVHMLAISGLHVGIVAWGLVLAVKGRLVPERMGIVGVMIFTWLYTLVTGAAAPVLRANLLVQGMCLGWLLRRRTTPLNSLAIAALLVWFRNPADLFHVGAQLSFLAVAVLIGLPRRADRSSPDPLDQLLMRHQPWYRRLVTMAWHRLSWSLWTSLAIWFFTAPLVVQRFHLIAWVTTGLNLLLWAPLTVALLSGMGVLLLHDWLSPLAGIFAGVCRYSLKAFEAPVHELTQHSWSYSWSAGCGEGAMLAFYLLWAASRCSVWLRRHTRLTILLSMVVLIVGATTLRCQRFLCTDEIRCTVLAVGHGTCVVLEFPRNQVWLYDCGRIGWPDSTVDMVSRFLWSRGITRLQKVVVSHADSDHYNILPGLLERFGVKTIASSRHFWHSAQEGVRQLKEQMERHSIRREQCQFGDRWTIQDRVFLDVLHPQRGQEIGMENAPSTDNAQSVVLAVYAWGHRLLLPGDLEADGLECLVSEPWGQATMAMAPHHGSMTESEPVFVRWCRPEWLVISGRWPANFEGAHHPLTSQLASGRVFHTDLDGAVQLCVRRNEAASLSTHLARQ